MNRPVPGSFDQATASVFVTHRNPIAGGPELVPLYRYSWACTDAVGCTKVSHGYTTATNEGWMPAGYQIDGIE